MPREVIVAPNAADVGRALRERLDREEPVYAFVGDPDADADAVEEFRRDVIRDAG